MPGHWPRYCHLYQGRDMRHVTGECYNVIQTSARTYLAGMESRDHTGTGTRVNQNWIVATENWELEEAQKLEAAVILVRVAWGGNRSGVARQTRAVSARPGGAGALEPPYLRSASWAPLYRAAAICKALIIYQTRDMTDKMSQGLDGSATWSVSMNTPTKLQNSICSLIQLKGFNLFDHNVQLVFLSHCAPPPPLLLIHDSCCWLSHVTPRARDAVTGIITENTTRGLFRLR